MIHTTFNLRFFYRLHGCSFKVLYVTPVFLLQCDLSLVLPFTTQNY